MFEIEPEYTEVVEKEEVFNYLESLRDGKIAKFFFVNHTLQEEFSISDDEARSFYRAWMRTLG